MDARITNEGSLYLLTPISDVAKDWVEERLSDDRSTLGNSIAVEPRYIMDITVGMIESGLEVEVDGYPVKISEQSGDVVRA